MLENLCTAKSEKLVRRISDLDLKFIPIGGNDTRNYNL